MTGQELQQPSADSWLVRHEFLIRRLHSLSGLIPVGAFMTVHLLVNASVLDGPAAFQKNVYSIHSLGRILPLVEWVFIFLPILFHAVVGIAIIRGGLSNSQTYPYSSNIRYTLQRVSGMIAFVFILWHVFHMHGWIHAEAWREFASRFMGAQFAAYNATSTAAAAMQAFWLVPLLYAIGILASVFHLANGIWTMGITWGAWISPAAQRRALVVCGAFGLMLAAVGLGSIGGLMRVDVPKAYEIEEQMIKARIASGDIRDNSEKRRAPHETTHGVGYQAPAAETAP